MATLKVTLEHEGHRLEVKDIDGDGELGIIMTSDKDESQCIFICEEQVELLRDHLTRIIKRRQ